jgi:hypothetical protein
MDAPAGAVDGVLAGRESLQTDKPNAQWHHFP